MNALLEAQRKRVGRRIRNARVTAGLTHDQLGAKVGTSRQHLIKLEKGQHLPGETMLARIAEATGKPERYFSADDDEEADLVGDLLRTIRAIVREEVKSNEPSGSREEALLGSSTHGG